MPDETCEEMAIRLIMRTDELEQRTQNLALNRIPFSQEAYDALRAALAQHRSDLEGTGAAASALRQTANPASDCAYRPR